MADEIFGLKRGTVLENADPDGMGRLIIGIPGLADEGTGWAQPMGLPGAGAGLGTWSIPPIGAQVFVLFEDGDIDSPVWAAGPFTRTEQSNIPRDALAAVNEDAKDAHRLKVIETDFFTITWDERTDPDAPFDPERSKQFLRLEHKLSGDFLELDGIRRGLYIKMTSQVFIDCVGLVNINGAQIQLNDRVVQFGNKPL